MIRTNSRTLARELLLPVLVLVTTFMFWGCSETPVAPESGGDENIQVTMNLQPALDLGFSVTRVHVTISRAAFTAEQDLEISGSQASGTFESLEAGSYAIEVEIFDGDTVIATGSGSGEVIAGQVTVVEIEVSFLGDLQIVVNWGSGGVIAHWDFNEAVGDTAHDKSGNGHHGVIDGASWTTGVGGSGSALQLDGVNDCVTMAGGSWLTQPKGTVEAWVKLSSGGRIVSTETSGWHNGFHLGWAGKTGPDVPINGILGGIHSTEGGNHYAEAYIPDVSFESWHFIACTWDADSDLIVVFVDGVASTVASPHPGMTDTGEVLAVGCWDLSGSRGGFVAGVVDEITFYDRVLSVNELLGHFDEGSPGPVGAAETHLLGITAEDQAKAFP